MIPVLDLGPCLAGTPGALATTATQFSNVGGYPIMKAGS